jgi:hypothetical protein
MASIEISHPIENGPSSSTSGYIYSYSTNKGSDVKLAYDGKLLNTKNNILIFVHNEDNECKFFTHYINVEPKNDLRIGNSYYQDNKIGETTQDKLEFKITETKNGNPIDASHYFNGTQECSEESTKKKENNKKNSSSGGSGGNFDVNLPNLLNPYFVANIPARVAFGGIKALKDLLLKKEGVENGNQILEEIQRIKQLMK